MSLCFRITEFFHQRVFYLLGQFIREVAVRGGIFFGNSIYHLDPGIDIVGQGFFLLCFCNITLFEHILQDDFAFFRVGLLPADRI